MDNTVKPNAIKVPLSVFDLDTGAERLVTITLHMVSEHDAPARRTGNEVADA